MTTSIRTQEPTFHSLRADAPVGRAAQIFTKADYAGTVVQVWHLNAQYWTVTTRELRNAFRNPVVGVSAHVWYHGVTGRYVADYHTDDGRTVEIGSTRDPRAALGLAIMNTARRGHDAGRW